MFQMISEMFIIIIHLLKIIAIFVGIIVALILLSIFKMKYMNRSKRRSVTFIHPKCSDCGGGEKVLWLIIKSLLDYKSNNGQTIKINIVATVPESAEIIRNQLKAKFGIDLTTPSSFVNEVEIIRIKSGGLLKPYPYLTMLFQILAQIVFSYDILTTVNSDLFIDTTGLPFTYLLLSLFGKKVCAYVHYPFISIDMINDVKANVYGMHSRGVLSQFKTAKIFYYQIILFLYQLCGKCVSYAQCNSTWTYNHIAKVWKSTFIDKLFPPCTTSRYKDCLNLQAKRDVIVSFAQFRPEKNQEMQIRILEKLVRRGINVELHMIGGVRNDDDKKLFARLEKMVIDKGLVNNVKMIANASLETIKEEFTIAKIGIHTMKDEHFGISIIEMMAAGLIVIAHNSAGAKEDIIVPEKNLGVGFVVNTEDDYVNQIDSVLKNYNRFGEMRRSALRQAESFSDESFIAKFQQSLGKMFII